MKNEYNDVLVYVEQRHGQIEKVSLELISKGREIADELDCKLKAVVLYEHLNVPAETLIGYGADEVIAVESNYLEPYRTEPYTKALTSVITEYKPEIVLIGATTIGRDLAPRVSARIDTGLTADCTTLEVDTETRNLLMTRPAFGGNLMATIICPDHRPQMSTVRPGVMTLSEQDMTRQGEVINFFVDFQPSDINIEILEEVKAETVKTNIEDANILISCGRGLGHVDNLSTFKSLAEKLGGSIAASRGAVDSGWVERNFQVGQTGKTVRPDLYIACGISGQIQHVAGMEESGLIIAVNKDETAPIFDVADLGIVGDMHQIVPELIKLLD